MELVIDGTKLFSSFKLNFFFQFTIVKCDADIEQFIIKITS